MSELIAIFATSQIKWVVWLILVDYVLGLVGAIVKKEFRLGKVAKVMGGPILKYLLGLGILGLVAQATGMGYLTKVGTIIVALAMVGSILENLGKFGISVPVWLKRE